jgi:DNA-binding MarR family transcriptional regulator
MNTKQTKYNKLSDPQIIRLNRTINNALYKFNQENDIEMNDIQLINIYKKVNKALKNPSSGRSNPGLYDEDFTDLEGKILARIAEQPTTRRELADKLDIQASSIAGIVGGKLIKNGWVEVIRYRKCSVTRKRVQELSITATGISALSK